MKKLLLYLIILLALPAVFADVSVSHSYEQRQDGLYVHVLIKSQESGKFDLGELIPESWQVESWTANAGDIEFESVNGKFMDQTYKINHWKFGNLEKDSELVYKISPKTSGDYELVSVWFNPSGFSMEKLNLNVKF